jgi:hypothetical protein
MNQLRESPQPHGKQKVVWRIPRQRYSLSLIDRFCGEGVEQIGAHEFANTLIGGQ